MVNINRREFIKLASSGLVEILFPELIFGEPQKLKIIDHHSPKRKTRANRLSTDYILLHTTEGRNTSALDKLTKRGEANYMVDTNGDIYRIMGINQISTGAGRSMWNGKTNLDNHAINIEFVGYHNIKPTNKQLKSGRELISELKEIYRHINDENIISHSMVAYGASNRWNMDPFRGRKRCGMLFAKIDVRESLGLKKRPKSDPDVQRKRLIAADSYLESVLYGTGQPLASSVERSDEPERIISTINKGETPWTYAGNKYADSTTIYFLNDGRIRSGDELKRQGFDFNSVPIETRISVGYVYGGRITGNRTAYSVVGKNWNLPSTMYRFPDKRIITGDDISEVSIPNGTIILFRR